MTALVRQVEFDVHVGFPGLWRVRTVFLAPERWAVTVYTTAEQQHYVYDGRTAAAFVGGLRVSEVAAGGSVRSQARFTAVTLLDALRLPGVTVAETPPAAPGVAAALTAVFADDGSRYRVGLDARGLVVRVEGPLVLDPVGRGPAVATYADFRRVDGRLLPHRTAWALAGTPVADERVLRVCLDPPGLDAAAFAAPARLPECAPGEPGGG